MSTYSLEEILQRWKREDLTAEQAIGQLIQHTMALSRRVGTLERERLEERRRRDERMRDEG